MAEARKMNYEMWFDEKNGVLYVKTLAMLERADVEDIIPEVAEMLAGKEHRYILGDLAQNPSGLLTKDARTAFKENAENLQVDKIAIIGANPSIRMIAKIALTIMGKSDIAKFFKTEEEALVWLKGAK
ncbi:STAS/SEC14 domain-containing protein [bacterium]|nr:STAS/SEC14 domain-containing protein [bacterium]